MKLMIQEAIDRITEMERCYDALREGADEELAMKLRGYYESGLWLRDYELDERGLLPGELKRGVLSQDGLFNLLEEINT